MVKMSQINRIPPHDDEAERAVLGALLLDKNAFDITEQYLDSDDFYSGANGRIYKVIRDLLQKGYAADIITVRSEFEQNGGLDTVGGTAYIASLTNVVPSIANIEYYAKIVFACSVKRALFRTANTIIDGVFDESVEYGEILEKAQKDIFGVAENKKEITYKKLKDIVPLFIKQTEERVKSGNAITGVPSGFSKLDEMTSGFQPSDFIVIGARPSVGKTALALSMAAHIAIKKKIPAAFFSLEMSDLALSLRLFAGESRIDAKRLKNGFLKSDDFPKLMDTAGFLYDAPLYIVAAPNMKLSDLRSQARRLKIHEKVEIIFIDYLTLVTPENIKLQTFDQFAEISKSLKSLARELDIPIVVLSQLNRQTSENGAQLSNIRASGAIEQDADLIIFLERKIGESAAKINVVKQRQGEVGEVDILFLPQYTRFENLAREE
jgi:replicative DNA helicase